MFRTVRGEYSLTSGPQGCKHPGSGHLVPLAAEEIEAQRGEGRGCLDTTDGPENNRHFSRIRRWDSEVRVWCGRGLGRAPFLAAASLLALLSLPRQGLHPQGRVAFHRHTCRHRHTGAQAPTRGFGGSDIQPFSASSSPVPLVQGEEPGPHESQSDRKHLLAERTWIYPPSQPPSSSPAPGHLEPPLPALLAAGTLGTTFGPQGWDLAALVLLPLLFLPLQPLIQAGGFSAWTPVALSHFWNGVEDK